MSVERAAKLTGALALAGTLAAVVALSGSTASRFSGPASNPANELRVAPDFVAPSVTGTVIAKTPGYEPGYVRQGGVYRVHANLTDSGSPPSGVATVTADASAITPGAAAAPLSAGTFSAGGGSYGWRSATLTASAVLAEGTYTYSITAADADGNQRTSGGHTVVVDNTPPAASDVQSSNASGGTAGRAEEGDTIAYTFTEPIDPESVLAGWNGSPTPVVVRVVNGLVLLGNDTLHVRDSGDGTQLPLGSVNLGRNDYVGGLLGLGESVRFGATGTASSMALSGSAITITLGTAGSGVTTAAGSGTMQWSPAATPYDRAGNPSSAASATESGGADREF